ncbi:Integral membrane protein TerC [Citrifermentans bremense]|uniref:Integral membrane protein TerC n=1 Tax=Citrifermentans bremense TaxID=60035 RepID=A0A6S6LYW4_9BACT|nr:TerC/Alx family metal homeostasis membrane protein [Citrifermentans bremense]BCG46130.1 Integral membrane protein TerC [Citrifermentans bremense]
MGISAGMSGQWGWTLFGITVVLLLAVDLVMHRGGHGTSRKSSYLWSAVWIAAGLLFTVVVYRFFGAERAEEYVAAYLMEKSLSVDNLFVFLIIFRSLEVDAKQQHKVLFWGIIGALVFRAIFIFIGIAAINRFHWLAIAFGLMLLFTAYRAAVEDPAQKSESELIKRLSRYLPLSKDSEGGRWYVRREGKLYLTPLAVALIAVELTDVMFAIDSVPAVFAVSRDPFVVYSSNIFAILGLRALYTALEHNLRDFPYLHYGLSGVLAFAGLKLVFAQWLKLPPLLSVAIIASIIGASVWASIAVKKKG